MALVRASMPYRAIAKEVGCDVKTVTNDVKAWFAENRPDPVDVEAMRFEENETHRAWQRRLEDLYVKQDELAGQLSVVDRLFKLSDMRRRLNGLDAQPDSSLIAVLSQEDIARVLMGQLAALPGVIDVEAKEIHDAE